MCMYDAFALVLVCLPQLCLLEAARYIIQSAQRVEAGRQGRFNCAGCSVQEELFVSFEQILAVSDRNKTPFDRIVLENSGVAEPQNIREAFAQAVEVGHPVIKRIHLSTMVCPPSHLSTRTIVSKISTSPTLLCQSGPCNCNCKNTWHIRLPSLQHYECIQPRAFACRPMPLHFTLK